MSISVTGEIASVSRNGRAFRIKEDEDNGDNKKWYSVFEEKQMNGADRGDIVSFEYTEKKSGTAVFRNVKGKVKVEETAQASPLTSASDGEVKRRVGFPVDPLDRDRSIIRRHAVSTAMEAVLKADPDIDPGTAVDCSIEYARTIERYTSGDEAMEEVMNNLEDE